MAGFPKNLLIPSTILSSRLLKQRSEELGFSQPNTLEALIWDYELYAQISQRAPDSFLLKGGAAVQLYVPMDRQRASVDVDILTTLEQPEVSGLLEEISLAYDISEPYLRFEPYIPEEPAEIEGLYSYTVVAPSSLGQKWRMGNGTMIEARMVKVDIHETNRLPASEEVAGEVVGLSLGYNPMCVPKGFLFAEKLLTQARRTVGIPNNRYHDLPKHLYDLDSLLCSVNMLDAFVEAAEWLPPLIEEQGKPWRGERGIKRVLDDLESSLLNMALIDYSNERTRFENAVKRLETLYLPSGSRMRLHRWAAVAAKTLAIVRLLRMSISGENCIQEQYLLFDRCATDVMNHPDKAGLAKALYKYLPSSIKSVRQLKGSPPGRIFWLLATVDNLSELEKLISGN